MKTTDERNLDKPGTKEPDMDNIMEDPCKETSQNDNSVHDESSINALVGSQGNRLESPGLSNKYRLQQQKDCFMNKDTN